MTYLTVPTETNEELRKVADSDYVRGEAETEFSKLLNRYISELHDKGISTEMIAEITGVSESSIRFYLKGTRTPSLDSLIALCIGMRLYPERSFLLLNRANHSLCEMKQRDRIMKKYLFGCIFRVEYDVKTCNQELKEKHLRPLTKL